MSDLKYEPVYPLTRSELIHRFESDDPEAVTKALYAATRFEDDWSWVELQCLKALKSPSVSVRWAAATCLGDMAFMRRPLDVASVVPALELAVKDPEIADPASFSLSMVKQFSQEK